MDIFEALSISQEQHTPLKDLQGRGTIPLHLELINSVVLEPEVELVFPLPVETQVAPYYYLLASVVRGQPIRYQQTLVFMVGRYSQPDWSSLVDEMNQLFAPDTILSLKPYRDCANQTTDPTVYTRLEKGLPFCYDTEDLDLVQKTGLNPYTGRSDPLAETGRFSDISISCVSSGKLPSLPPDYHPLSNYTLNYQPILQRIQSLDRVRRVAEYKRCDSLTVYRGILLPESIRSTYPVGSTFDIVVKSFNSWTVDLATALRYATTSSNPGGLVLETVALPEDVSYDTRVAEDNPNQSLAEVRLRPGVYSVVVRHSH
jgi:hypothetical protein